MKTVSLSIISSNIYLKNGWVAFINTIQPELLSKTNKLCDLKVFRPDEIENLLSRFDLKKSCIIVDRALTSTESWAEFHNKCIINQNRIFIINDTTLSNDCNKDIMPFKPSLKVIKKLIIEGMMNDSFLMNDAVGYSLNDLSVEEKGILRWILAGKSVRELSEIYKVSSKNIYHIRKKIIHKLGFSNVNELVRKINPCDKVTLP